jgi:hypothetical protein
MKYFNNYKIHIFNGLNNFNSFDNLNFFMGLI